MENEKITLWKLLEEVKDPRSPLGRRYALANILRMILNGLLCGCNCTAGIVRWAKRLSKNHKQMLGFAGKIPSEGALSNLFSKMDVAAMEEVLNKNKLKQSAESRSLLQIAI